MISRDSTSLPIFDMVNLFNFSYSNRCVVISCHGFNLCFPGDYGAEHIFMCLFKAIFVHLYHNFFSSHFITMKFNSTEKSHDLGGSYIVIFIYLFYLFIFGCIGSLLRCMSLQALERRLSSTGLVAPRHVGSSRTRARARVPCIGRQILNHCATREVPVHCHF